MSENELKTEVQRLRELAERERRVLRELVGAMGEIVTHMEGLPGQGRDPFLRGHLAKAMRHARAAEGQMNRV